MKKIVIMFFLITLGASGVRATTYPVFNTMLTPFTVSETYPAATNAHMVESSAGIYNSSGHPWCKNRAYVDFADKSMMSLIISASISQQPLNFIYEDDAPVKGTPGHIGATPGTPASCKVVSVFR